MSEKYNKIVANHYSAYRPPLHEIILKKVLSENEKFECGLDIGCGTGYSAIALTNYCSHVIGVEPSKSMLDKSIPNKKITYLQGFGNCLPPSIQSANIVTFAGSLFYTKSSELTKELKRVCSDNALIVVYDFMVLFEEILGFFDIKRKKTDSDYNHEENFNDNTSFNKISSHKEQISLTVTAEDLAHVLLANSNILDLFMDKYNITDPFFMLVKELEATKKQLDLKVNIYYSKYKINTDENRAKK